MNKCYSRFSLSRGAKRTSINCHYLFHLWNVLFLPLPDLCCLLFCLLLNTSHMRKLVRRHDLAARGPFHSLPLRFHSLWDGGNAWQRQTACVGCVSLSSCPNDLWPEAAFIRSTFHPLLQAWKLSFIVSGMANESPTRLEGCRMTAGWQHLTSIRQGA